MFYRLTQASPVGPNGTEAQYHQVEALNYPACEWPWLHGVSFGEEKPEIPLDLKLETTAEVRLFADYMPWEIPLVSMRFDDVLRQAGVGNVESFPVASWSAAFGLAPRYLALNVVGAVAIADGATSKSYKPLGGGLGAQLFERLVIDPARARGLHIFRMAESLSTLVVSERVRQFCAEANLTSLRFLPLKSV